jgi:iron complex transport system permease protein
MILLLLCDVIAQLPGSQTVLPINIITSLVGSPLVITLLLRQKSINAW